MHVLATGERDGYYADYVPHPAARLSRALAEGFDYQGERSAFRDGRLRGEPSGALPPSAFVAFLQNHDQIGNRALGERISALAPARALRCLTSLLLLAPQPPLLFMGQEFAADSPFQFFCDFEPELARAVREGRRGEFARFAQFSDGREREKIPDPNELATFARSRLDWSELERGDHAAWLDYHRELLQIRRRHIVPLLPRMRGNAGSVSSLGENAFHVAWVAGNGLTLTLLANLGDADVDAGLAPRGRLIHTSDEATAGGMLRSWSVACYLEAAL
jgi:malto-oligosyltrehalose trehalohydrolase